MLAQPMCNGIGKGEACRLLHGWSPETEIKLNTVCLLTLMFNGFHCSIHALKMIVIQLIIGSPGSITDPAVA